jgi:hypothetical protein
MVEIGRKEVVELAKRRLAIKDKVDLYDDIGNYCKKIENFIWGLVLPSIVGSYDKEEQHE